MKRHERSASALLDAFFKKRGNPPQDWIDASHDRLLGKLRSGDETIIGDVLPDTEDFHGKESRRWTLALASAAVLAIALLVSVVLPPTKVSTVSSVEGAISVAGDTISSSGPGVLVLKDGSRVEMRPLSELSLQQEQNGILIHLNKGGVTVNAAKQQQNRRLYVKTRDVTVSVVGTVFLVSIEKEGSHVAVIEGMVIAEYGMRTVMLNAGEELSTAPPPELTSLEGAEQPQDKKVAFEVATVKVTPPDARDNGSMTLFPPGRFRKTNATLRDLVALAFAVQDYQISGGPEWSRSDRYDVEGKAETNVARDQILLMIQTLLADRFKLKARETAEEASVYRLRVSGNGLKMKPAPESQTPNARFNKFEGQRTMERFVEYLSDVVGQPVVDGTALIGPYDIKLEFTPEWVRERFAGRGGTVSLNGESLDMNGPSIFTALETQLGLRLEGAKGPVRFVVIQSAGKPSEN
jgi:uncharacterized protein (TIGR03435 family)